jgi:hypothetical protein
MLFISAASSKVRPGQSAGLARFCEFDYGAQLSGSLSNWGRVAPTAETFLFDLFCLDPSRHKEVPHMSHKWLRAT